MFDAVNPYIAGNPVTGSEMFFGREDVFQFISQTLIGRHRDNVIVLYGQQRAGKTSVLYQLSRHLDAHYLCIFVDLHGLALDSLEGFLWELANHIVRTLRRDYHIDLPLLNRSEFMTDSRSAFEDGFLSRVWSAIGDQHVLLMLDEAMRLQEQVRAGKLEQEIFAYMRHLMQHYERLDFLFSLGSGLEEMEKEYAFLFNVGLYKKISFLDRNAAVALITEPVKDHYELESTAVEQILHTTSGHPYYTQLLCHSLFNRCRQLHTSLVEVQDVDAVLDEVVERGLAVLKHTWEESTPGEKAVMASMATAMGEQNCLIESNTIGRIWAHHNVSMPKGEMAKAIKDLISRDIIIGQDKYTFTVDLQRLWVQKYRRLEWVREEIVDTVRAWSPNSVIDNWRPQWQGWPLAAASLLLLLVFVVVTLLRSVWTPPIPTPPTPSNPVVATVSLHYSRDLDHWGITSFTPAFRDLAERPPANNWITPSSGGLKRLYGILKFGKNTQIGVMLDVLDKANTEAQITFAFDGDTNFSNKPSYKTIRGVLPKPIEFEIAYPDGSHQKYAIDVAFLTANSHPYLEYWWASMRLGMVNLGGTEYQIAIGDFNTDGSYSLNNTKLWMDVDRDGKFEEDETFPANSVFEINGNYYTIAKITPGGDHMTITQAGVGGVVGRVLDANNAPVPNATVTLSPGEISATTGADGSYRIEAPEGRYWQIVASAEGFVPELQDLDKSVVAGQTLRLDDISLSLATTFLSGTIQLKNGDSYHFLAGKHYSGPPFSGGDFYVSISGTDVEFLANSAYERGIQDLRNIGTNSLFEVQPPNPGQGLYYLYGVPAIVGHTYVSLAKKGEEGHYIIFRVTQIQAGMYVEIAFYYR